MSKYGHIKCNEFDLFCNEFVVILGQKGAKSGQNRLKTAVFGHFEAKMEHFRWFLVDFGSKWHVMLKGNRPMLKGNIIWALKGPWAVTQWHASLKASMALTCEITR